MEQHRPETIETSRQAANWMRKAMSFEQEELWLLALASNKRLLSGKLLFRGTADACLAHPRDVMRAVCLSNAVGFLLGHNHPSGETTPSRDDWEFTETILHCGSLFQIPLLDHLIVTADDYTSLRSLNEGLFLRSVSGWWKGGPGQPRGGVRPKEEEPPISHSAQSRL